MSFGMPSAYWFGLSAVFFGAEAMQLATVPGTGVFGGTVLLIFAFWRRRVERTAE